MAHPMRRADRAASAEDTMEILHEAQYAVLSLVDPEGHPYGVPLSYAFEETSEGLVLYFHAAVEGRKLDCLRAHPEAHCVVVSGVRTLPEKFSTTYRSVMLEGELRLLEDEPEKIRALLLLASRYSPGLDEAAEKYARKAPQRVTVLRLLCHHVSGKQRR